MLRIIVQTNRTSDKGTVSVILKTFDVEAPELEKYSDSLDGNLFIIGIERLMKEK